MQSLTFPYPVLNYNDDVSSDIEIKDPIQISYTTDEVNLSFRIATSDAQLIELCDRGDFEIVAKWECSATLCCGNFDLASAKRQRDGFSFECRIPQDLVAGRVLVSLFAVAAREIDNFSWQRCHPDFGSISWQVSKGDVVAQFGEFGFNVDKLYDPSDPPLGSLIQTEVDSRQKDDLVLNLDSDEYVIVTLSESLAESLSTQREEVKLALVVLPALIQMISDLKAEVGESGDITQLDSEWKKGLHSLIHRLGLYAHEPLTIAQRMMTLKGKGPVMNALSAFEVE